MPPADLRGDEEGCRRHAVFSGLCMCEHWGHGLNGFSAAHPYLDEPKEDESTAEETTSG